MKTVVLECDNCHRQYKQNDFPTYHLSFFIASDNDTRYSSYDKECNLYDVCPDCLSKILAVLSQFFDVD